MTFSTAQNRGITSLVAMMAEEVGVLSPQRHGVTGFLTRRRGRPQREKRPALSGSVAGSTGVVNGLAGLVDMLAVVAYKAARPVAMAYVVGVSQPVYLHIREDTPFINGRNRFNRLIDERFLALEDIRAFLGIEAFDGLPDLL